MVEQERAAIVGQRYRDAVAEQSDPHDWAHAWRAELNRGGFEAYELLRTEVIDAGKCVGCAACVTICPTDVFDYQDEHPIDARPEACVRCVLCADVCPVLRPPDASMEADLKYMPDIKDDGFGPYSYEVLARSTRPEIVTQTQDGGVVSMLLIDMLERGLIKGAIVGDIDPEDPQVGRHFLAKTEAEVLATSGSRYTYSPNTLAFQQAMAEDVRPLAVVGVPCQVDGVRLQQYSGLRMELNRWYRSNVALVIGLFCSESFTHDSVSAIGDRFGVTRQEIRRINIKGKVVVDITDGRTESMSLKKFRGFARPACHYCKDYGADQSDIAVGGLGLDDWSYVVVRTEAGHEAFQRLLDNGAVETRPVSDAPKSRPLLIRLSETKREGALPAQLAPHLDIDGLPVDRPAGNGETA
ncbi:MAG: Coenzyme F420 hydrogenase/dehydrogenase, beta subunit C-terminal domain [Dehalococcoidia bacterium]|jgi:coenzyme F420 hydrogenase subunit beta|nr:Coenzyme F420 hydrogenase/dehydrogenase, beta subunit C-terminal domain [Dehalococcoidia bacterium]